MKPLTRGALCAALICAFGWSGVATAANPPVLHRYSTGKRVAALQWLLSAHRPSAFRIRAYRGPINGHFDQPTARAVVNMKYRLGWPKQRINATAGPFFFDVLKGTTTRPFAYRLAAGKRVVATQNLTTPTLPTMIQTLVDDAKYLIARAPLVHYSQTVRMQIVRQQIHLPPLNRYIYEDCSSSTTGLYWLAGLPDPNGRGYDGYGYTGTQSAHGRVVWRLGQPLSQLRPGDLIFYGGGWPHHHVTMYLGAGRVFSHGTETGPFNLPVLYRNDAVSAHRYVSTG